MWSRQQKRVPFGCNACSFSSFSIRKFMIHVKEEHVNTQSSVLISSTVAKKLPLTGKAFDKTPAIDDDKTTAIDDDKAAAIDDDKAVAINDDKTAARDDDLLDHLQTQDTEVSIPTTGDLVERSLLGIEASLKDLTQNLTHIGASLNISPAQDLINNEEMMECESDLPAASGAASFETADISQQHGSVVQCETSLVSQTSNRVVASVSIAATQNMNNVHELSPNMHKSLENIAAISDKHVAIKENDSSKESVQNTTKSSNSISLMTGESRSTCGSDHANANLAIPKDLDVLAGSSEQAVLKANMPNSDKEASLSHKNLNDLKENNIQIAKATFLPPSKAKSSSANKVKTSSKLENIVHSLRVSQNNNVNTAPSISVSAAKSTQSLNLVHYHPLVTAQDAQQQSIDATVSTQGEISELSKVNSPDLQTLSINLSDANASEEMAPVEPTFVSESHAPSNKLVSIHPILTQSQQSCNPTDACEVIKKKRVVTMPNTSIMQYVDSSPQMESVLFSSYTKFPYPPREELHYLSTVTGLSIPDVKSWFAGTRLKFDVSWSPDEVMTAWSIATQRGLTCAPKASSISAPKPSQAVVEALGYPQPAKKTQNVLLMACTCGIEHQLSKEQIDMLNLFGTNLEKIPDGETLRRVVKMTSLSACAVISFFKSKIEINNRKKKISGERAQNTNVSFSQIEPTGSSDLISGSVESSIVSRPKIAGLVNASDAASMIDSDGLDVLHESFCIEPYLNNAELKQIKLATGMSKSSIKEYFIKKRSKMQSKLTYLGVDSNLIAIYENHDLWLKDVAKSRTIHQQNILKCAKKVAH